MPNFPGLGISRPPDRPLAQWGYPLSLAGTVNIFLRHAVNINEYDKLKASLKLMSQLAQGEQAGKEKGWMTIEELEAVLGIGNV